MPASKERKDDESSHLAGRDKVNDGATAASRNESEAGGVRLPQIEGETLASAASAGSAKRKRRPKKQTGKPSGLDTAVPAAGIASTTAKASTKDVTISVEVQALKNKVQEIEQQVQEILLRPQLPPKSARRRQRQKKGHASPAGEAEEHEASPTSEHKELVSDTKAELEKLQKELEDAQDELLTLRAKKKKSSNASSSRDQVDEEGVEEIPRMQGPGLVEVQRPRPLGRAVTLTGSYRIPLPADVSNADLDAISRGIKSAQNIARSFITDFEHARAIERAPGMPQQGLDSGGGTWSEWFGGYSMSIARAVEGMRVTSNIRTTPKRRPGIAGRAETTPPARRKPRKLEIRSQKRPPAMPEGAQRRLSETQVAGLLA